ncbi:unnamed protein product [Cuscuta europaea]|uniref:RNase H type-1 domain-containing protein n=1 Tax=Cuscuta europaea TaxID=41803 RepID=A0A9P1E682_CUSEU|nr:unnamed protein product [Cuscuta europaea]
MGWMKSVFQIKQGLELQSIAWGCWGLWGERNARVWQRRELGAASVMLTARNYVDVWLQVQRGRLQGAGGMPQSQIWHLPASGWFKLNVDAARDDAGSGLGWVVRNDSGDFVAGGVKPGGGSCSPLEAELLSTQEALSWLKDREWDFVEVEPDSLPTIHEISNGSSISTVGILAEDTRAISSKFTFKFIRRSANKIAHELARVARSLSNSHSWIEFLLIVFWMLCLLI